MEVGMFRSPVKKLLRFFLRSRNGWKGKCQEAKSRVKYLGKRVQKLTANAIAAGLSSFTSTHHQGLDLARHPGKSKPTQKKLRAKDRPLANDFISHEAFDQMLHAWFGNMARVLHPGRGFYLWGGYANCANYPPVLKACGLYFSQSIIWVKEHPVLTRKDYMGNHEWCFTGGRKGPPIASTAQTMFPMCGASRRFPRNEWNI